MPNPRREPSQAIDLLVDANSQWWRQLVPLGGIIAAHFVGFYLAGWIWDALRPIHRRELIYLQIYLEEGDGGVETGAGSASIGGIVRSWRPSRAGGLAGVSLIGQGADALLDSISATCRIGTAATDSVNVLFETSRQCENLGIDLLVRAAECRRVLEELSKHGLCPR